MRTSRLLAFLCLAGIARGFNGTEIATIPITVYHADTSGAVSVSEARQIKLPIDLNQLLPIGAELTDSALRVQLEDAANGRIQNVNYTLPEVFVKLRLRKMTLRTLVTGSGDMFIAVGDPKKFTQEAAGGYRLLSITATARNDLLVANGDKMGKAGSAIIGLSPQNGNVLWSFDVPADYNAFMGELVWINDSVLLQRFMGHRGRAFGIIDIANKRILKVVGFKGVDADIRVINGKAMLRKVNEGKDGKIEVMSEQVFPIE